MPVLAAAAERAVRVLAARVPRAVLVVEVILAGFT